MTRLFKNRHTRSAILIAFLLTAVITACNTPDKVEVTPSAQAEEPSIQAEEQGAEKTISSL